MTDRLIKLPFLVPEDYERTVRAGQGSAMIEIRVIGSRWLYVRTYGNGQSDCTRPAAIDWVGETIRAITKDLE